MTKIEDTTKVEVAKVDVGEDNKFLGREKIGKLLRMFAIPCVVSLIIQALYNIVDQLFIGNADYLGSIGNTATGIVYPLTVIALAIGLFIGDGVAASMSIAQGKRQGDNIHKTVGTGISVGFVISVLLLAISYICCQPILKGFGASDAVLPYAKEYSTWIIAGFPFYLLSCVINPVIRADGSPKFALLAMALGAIINIILDPIFIFVAKMGMTGAALATFIGQGVTFALSIIYLFKSKSFKLKLNSFLPDFKVLASCLKLGISSFLTQIAIVIISIVNNNILFSYMPDDNSVIGLFTIAFKVFGIIISVAIGIASGGQPILGYNYGAKKYDRVKETFKLIMIVTLIVGIIATLLFELCPAFILSLFGYSEASTFGLNMFRIYLGLILFTCLTKAVSIFFQSIGMPVKATLVAVLRDLIFLIPLSICLPLIGGIDLFLYSAPISDILTMIVAVALLAVLFKNMKKQAEVAGSNEKPYSIDEAESQTNAVACTAINDNAFAGNTKVIVTISRQHGAGGREIGQKLAQKLNVPFYDKEVTAMVADETGLAQEYIDSIEQKDSLLYSLSLSTEANQMAITAQEKVLKMIAERESCVIVGRAADYVLREYNPFKVMVYAPNEFKVKRIMNNYGDDESQALANMEKSDKRRAKFYHSVTGQEWADKKNYDLCIDSSVGVDQTVETIYNLIQNKINNQ